jgi:hypothetical protein
MALGYTCFRVTLSSTTTSWYYNLVGVDRTSVSSYDQLPPGKHSIVLTFKYDGGGIGKGGLATLSVDGKKVADQKRARTIPFRVSADETLAIGEDTGTPVSEDYHVPFKFTGTLKLAWSGQSVVHQPPWTPFDFAQGKLRYTKEEDRR